MGKVENKTLRESLFFDFDIIFHIFMQDFILKVYRIFWQSRKLYIISGNFLTGKTRKIFETL